MNAYIAALHDYDSILDATVELSKLSRKLILLADFWMAISRFDAYKQWAGGFIYGYFFEKGLYDVSELNEFLKEWFTGRDLKLHLTIAVTNILTGK